MTAALTMATTAVMAVPHTIVSARPVVLTTYLVLLPVLIVANVAAVAYMYWCIFCSFKRGDR